MSRVRIKRLVADHLAVERLAAEHPRVTLERATGSPPDRYQIRLSVRSLREKGGLVTACDDHLLEVRLPLGYPRDAPLCRMLTPVFHPNIAPHVVCVGDHWTAGESLAALIQRVGEMLAYQSYNIKSPLNGEAARWVEANADKVPTDAREFFVDVQTTTAPQLVACANCEEPTTGDARCGQGHASCGDCRLNCEACGGALCLACGEPPCGACVT